jgi:hypothetical protein
MIGAKKAGRTKGGGRSEETSPGNRKRHDDPSI